MSRPFETPEAARVRRAVARNKANPRQCAAAGCLTPLAWDNRGELCSPCEHRKLDAQSVPVPGYGGMRVAVPGLRLAVVESGRSWREVAAEINQNAKSLYNWASGRTKPLVETAQEIARALGVPVEALTTKPEEREAS